MRHNFIHQRNCTSKDALENWRNRKEQKYRKNQGVRWLPSSSSLKNESLARQLQVLPDQDFATECFLEAWSAEETSGFISISKCRMFGLSHFILRHVELRNE